MKRIFTFLACCIPVYLFAQGFGSFSHDQPFFAADSTASFTPATLTNLIRYWNYSDLSDGTITNWVDRIQGSVLTQGNASQRPTKDSTGVLFMGDDVLTNAVAWNWNTANGMTWWVVVYRTNYNDSANTEIIDTLVGSGTTLWKLENTFMVFQSSNLGKNGGGGSVYRDLMLLDSTSISGNGFTNNVATSTAFNNTGAGSGIAVGNRYDGTIPFKGYIAEILIATNVFTSDQRNALHNYATNTYGFSP